MTRVISYRIEEIRARLLTHGGSALSDTELLALLLRTEFADRDTTELAAGLLGKHQTLRSLIKASGEDCTTTLGLSEACRCQLEASAEMARRLLKERISRGKVLSNPAQVKRYLRVRLSDRPREIFFCMYLNKRHSLMATEELFQGTLDNTYIYLREVVRACLKHRAAAVIFAHNHPSGTAEPSDADRRITVRLKDALELIEVALLDHLVVGANEVVSFSERGIL